MLSEQVRTAISLKLSVCLSVSVFVRVSVSLCVCLVVCLCGCLSVWHLLITLFLFIHVLFARVSPSTTLDIIISEVIIYFSSLFLFFIFSCHWIAKILNFNSYFS